MNSSEFSLIGERLSESLAICGAEDVPCGRRPPPFGPPLHRRCRDTHGLREDGRPRTVPGGGRDGGVLSGRPRSHGVLRALRRHHLVRLHRALPRDQALPDDAAVRSLCLFGTAEEVRNIAALVHFDRADPFSAFFAPWGPACATFVSYPAGIAAGATPDAAFIGPTDPTVNHALPPDIMGIGIPAAVARRMAGNLDASFVVRRPKVAFPDHGREV